MLARLGSANYTAAMKIIPLHDQLTDEIDAFLERHDMSDTLFGRLAMNDPAWLHRFRDGLMPRIDTVDHIRRFMAQYTSHPKRRACARACA